MFEPDDFGEALGPLADRPAAALPHVDALAAGQKLARCHLLWTVRGDLLFKLGRLAEARR